MLSIRRILLNGWYSLFYVAHFMLVNSRNMETGENNENSNYFNDNSRN